MSKLPLTRDRARTKALQVENRRLRQQVRDLKDQIKVAYALGSEDARAYLEGGGDGRPDVEAVGEDSS